MTGTNLGQRKHNEFRAWALLVPSVRLALVWRSSGVHIHTWKNAHIFEHAENEVDAHNKWITFIRRSRQIINEFWRTPSESQRTDQNFRFFVRWTCVMVCVTGPLLSEHIVTFISESKFNTNPQYQHMRTLAHQCLWVIYWMLIKYADRSQRCE